MRIGRRTLVALTVLLAAGLLLSLATIGTPQEVQADQKHVLRIGWLQEPDSLNPLIGWATASYEVYDLNYDYLVYLDYDLNIVPQLAHSWEMSEDGKTWTFYLEEGVNWHDGEPFTSADVKFTFEYIRDNGLSLLYDYVRYMESIETPDENTVVINLEAALAWMPFIEVSILPKHLWEDIDPAEAETIYENREPVGTGPFQVVEFRKGEYTRLVANKDYFGGGPTIDEVIFIQYATASTMAEALKLGEIDAITSVPAAQFTTLEGYPDIRTIVAVSGSFDEIAINNWQDPANRGNPLLLDANVRRAMEHAINKQHIIDVVYFGYREPGTTFIPPLYSYWHLDVGDDAREFDLDKAAQILDEAGYDNFDTDGVRLGPDGTRMEFRMFLRSESPEQVKAGMLIAEWFEEIGIQLNIQVMDEGTMWDLAVDDGNYDMYIWGWGVPIDPSFILSIFTTDQIMYWSDSFYSNPVYDELFEKQQMLIDPEERQEVVHEMQRIIHDDAPYIVLWYSPTLQAHRTDRFEGWVQTPEGGPVIVTINTLTYQELRPIETGAAPVAPADGGPTVWPWIVAAVVLVLFFVLRRKKSVEA